MVISNLSIVTSVADLFTNLSAGWLGAVIIISPFLNKNNKLSTPLLIAISLRNI